MPAAAAKTLLTSPPVEAKHPSDVIGNWGPIQRRILILVTLSYIVAPMNNSGIVFIAPRYDFFCNYLNETTGSYDKLKNACQFPDLNGIQQKCSNFTYDESVFKRTIVSEFNLVCDKSYYGSVSQSLLQLGYLISGVCLGYFSDRKGRKTAALVAISMEIAAGFGQVLSPSIYVFWVSRFFLGIANYGRFMACYVLLSEWVGPEARAQAIALYESGFFAAGLMLPVLFHAIADYKIMQSGFQVYELILLIPFAMIVWESPRWLLTHGRFEEAEDKLTKAAKAKQKLDEHEIKRRITSIRLHTESEVIADGAADQSVFDAWKVPAMRRLSMILYFCWFCSSFIYYAFTMNMQNLGGDLFTNYFIFAAVDGIVQIALYFIINRFARKTLLNAALTIQSVSLLFLLIFSFSDSVSNPVMYRIIISCFLKVGMGIGYMVNYLYTAETFPTSMRQASMGTCSIFSRIGSITAPFVKELTNATHLAVPTALFMLFTVTNLILIQFIPETGKIEMPDTIGQKKEQIDSRKNSTALSLHE